MRNIPVMKPYIDSEEAAEVEKVLFSGWVAQGPKVAEFEQLVAAYEGVRHGVAVTSCTTALHLLYLASGFRKGLDVLLPSYTFVATANAVEMTGATPVLVDVEKDTYNISVQSLEEIIARDYSGGLNKKTGNRLFAIVAVHLFGLCADMPAVNALAEKHGLLVIEDSACALGAAINGVKEGCFGNASCLSFHPRKSITTGEGGMVLCNDDALADRMRRLRSHGAGVSETTRHSGRGYLLPSYDEVGYNYRMTDIQAAVGVAQMRKIDRIFNARVALAARYDQLLAAVPFLKLPHTPAGYTHAFQSYVAMLDMDHIGILDVEEAHALRNELMLRLEDNGIATRQGTHAIHLLEAYRGRYGYKAHDFPQAYRCDRLSLTLPLYVGMSSEDQDYVVEQLRAKYSEIMAQR